MAGKTVGLDVMRMVPALSACLDRFGDAVPGMNNSEVAVCLAATIRVMQFEASARPGGEARPAKVIL